MASRESKTSLRKFIGNKNLPEAFKPRVAKKESTLTAADVWDHLQHTKEFLSKIKSDQDHIDIFIGSEPVRIEFMSDIHIGSSIVDLDSVRARVEKIIDTPGMLVIFGGDVIDGVNKEYLDTMGEQAALANVSTQIEAFQLAVFLPLFNAGKVLGAISGFSGHEEWIRKATGLPPAKALYNNLIPYLENGGEARIYSPDNDPDEENPDLTLYLAHNDGGGNNPTDPFKGLRSATENHPKVDGAASGHNHGVSAVGKVVNKDRTVAYVKEGTDKGNNTDMKDRLYTRDHPNSRILKGGSGFLIYDKDHGMPEDDNEENSSSDDDTEELNPSKIINYNILPAQDNYSPELAEKTYSDTTFEAIEIWDLLSRTGDLEAVLEESRQKAGGLSATLVKKHSVGEKYADDPTIHWQTAFYRIRPENPGLLAALKLELFNGARVPSGRTLWEDIKERAEEIANDPFTLGLTLREMFGKNMAKDPNVAKHFERLMRAMEPAMTEGKMLGWLHSGSMRDDRWGNFLPGKIINERYGVPLLNNHSNIILSVPNGPEFSIHVLDTTRYNSNTNMFHGPYKVMQKYPGSDLLIGGKSTQSGYESYRDGYDQQIKHILIPPWLNKETNIGEKGAWEPAPTNHAAVIFNLLTGEIEIGLTEYEVKDLYDAVQTWMAFSQSNEGLDYYKKLLRPRS